MVYKKILALFTCFLFLSGCQTAGQHLAAVQDKEQSLSVGTVQREIRVGMTNAEVAQILGSPNIVTTDDQRREVWVYDKMATDHVYSNSSSGISTLFLGFGANSFGGGGIGSRQNAGASSKSQRTLTVLIKYDQNGKVRDFAYHQSKF